MFNLIIIGAGGHASELVSYVRDMNRIRRKIRLIGFVDENRPSGLWLGEKIIGDFSSLKEFLARHSKKKFHYITAVGGNLLRKNFVAEIERINTKNLSPLLLRHPFSFVGEDVEIGDGSCLAPNCVVTTRVKIGRHCILNVCSSVSHDCLIGDFVNINPKVTVCGNVKIGNGCYIGAGATIIDKVSIGDWTVVGAGAVVKDDLPSYVTAVGVPARIIKRNKKLN